MVVEGVRSHSHKVDGSEHFPPDSVNPSEPAAPGGERFGYLNVPKTAHFRLLKLQKCRKVQHLRTIYFVFKTLTLSMKQRFDLAQGLKNNGNSIC